MALLREASNEIAYGKVGIMGFAAAGKTRTATEIAIGLHKMIGSQKPVAFLDTETGSDFVLPLFQAAGIKVLVAKAKTFTSLIEFMQEAQQAADIAIVDSITHIWVEIQQAFLDKINKDRQAKGYRKVFRLEFQHWNQIKPEWRRFTDLFLNCPMHVILCGRAGFEYDYEELEQGGKKELIKVGTKMKAEGEMAYEPSLLIEMERFQINPEYQKEAKTRQVINRAFVLKDRSDLLDGRSFDNPTFDTFRSHFEFLNIGGNHRPIDTAASSENLFDNEGRSDWDREKHEKTKALEEIQGLLTSKWPGQSAAEKKAKVDMLESIFGTRSWTTIEDMKLNQLLDGVVALEQKVQEVE
ncbi:AAA family ATPase [Geobacter sp. SVR]|uniref:AAA family ATPase n=1 Tax=Geobacter sp. SVR TaxID=2495594 RepID=UPI00143F042A|nr:AAA family ATPase [Geobacter sp. SVR]BCS54752.1 bacteriophage protein [Geobacter sp. SVR]GCF86440.1 bacteriophage protein [Geobacter sp. SVR]